MAFPQNDFIVSLEETNKAPQSIQPLTVVTQHDIAENSSLSNNAAPWAESPHFFSKSWPRLLLRPSSQYGRKQHFPNGDLFEK